jgi:predicted nucleic acid-binding protein
MLYLDTSVVVSLLLNDVHSAAVRRWFERRRRDAFAISDWTRVEFASAVARLERMGDLDETQAEAARAVFRNEIESTMDVLRLGREDFGLAVDLLAVRGEDQEHRDRL